MSENDTARDAVDTSRMGLIDRLIGEMHPILKFALLLLMVPVIVLALAGFLLQVNVGAIIQKELDSSRDKTVTSIRYSIDQRVDDLSASIAAS